MSPTLQMNGDRAWRGVNMRLDPAQLEPGWMSHAVNARFRNGIPETRRGSVVLPWLNKITGSSVGHWGTVYGVGEFRDPDTFTEYVLLAADGNVYACVENNAPYLLALPAGTTITTRVTFVQCFNVVVMLRGFDDDPLVMEDINEGFKAIVQSASAVSSGLLTIPRALRGVFAANRLFLLREDDTVVASDILDYTGYTLFNDFRVNQGDADKGVAIAAFGSESLIVFKQRSVYRIDHVYGNLESITFSLVTNRYGCVAAESVVNCGSDVLWLSQEGVASLTLTEQNEIQASQGALAGKNRMFSEPIGPLIERVNGRYIENANGAVWNDRYYLGLPLDQAVVYGAEMAVAQTTNEVGVLNIAGLTVGRSYRWVPADNGGLFTTSLVSGSTSSSTAITFTATATTATITASVADGFVLFDSFREIVQGANTVLAHYDFQNTAWGGYDEADTITFHRVFTASHLGRRRLFVIDDFGYVRQWEEGFADRLAEPYADVAVSTLPAPGDTIRVNGGDTVTAAAIAQNTGLQWGCNNLAGAQQNLFAANSTRPSYNPSSSGAWSAPNTIAIAAVPTNYPRFISTSGIVPVVVTTGTWAVVTYVVEQPVALTLETRGYTRADDALGGNGTAHLDVQTWNPETSLTLLSDGVNEEEELIADRTRDRTKYYRPFNRADYVASNINDDFNVPNRQDYSIEPSSSAYTFTPPASSSVNGDRHQSVRYPVRVPGAYRRVLRFRIENTQGRLRLQSLTLETTRAGRAGLAIRN